MRFGYSETCLDHDTGDRHPETADRLRAVRRGLARCHGVDYVAGDPATEAELTAVHDADYVAAVREFCADGGGQWDADTVASEATWDAALASAGQARWAACTALDGAAGRETPFALGRPPGHHATPDEAMGFCFFNNAAVAAEAALDGQRTPADASAADRVAIVDWDVHHGNGTQDAFYDRGDVLYASIHEGGLYPGTGAVEETGTGDGDGATLNVPLPAGADDADYRAAAAELVCPVVADHDPDLLVVSAGFDAHRHDPISRMRLSTEGYGVLTDRLRTAADDCGAAVAFVLEGGYSLDALADGVGMVHEVFDGREPVAPDGEPSDAVAERLDEVRAVHGL